MAILSLLLKLRPNFQKADGSAKTSGELIAEVTGGANLVDGKQTWELAHQKKDDLEAMIRCCHAELQTMMKTRLVAAPYYFERVAILCRKKKDYQREVFYCEQYINKVEALYAENSMTGCADVRKGPRFRAIVRRLPKAKALLKKSSG